ncbi:MAG: hypothetical protein HZA54_11590 [Planctomycetes bacterium]|nr:hypothetical protein [Planctomycetota bacterium]
MTGPAPVPLHAHAAAPAPVSGRRALGRFLSATGGLLLAVCFFLPMVEGCNGPESPRSFVADDAARVCREVRSGDADLDTAEKAYGVASITGPHLLGLAVAARVLWDLAWPGRGLAVLRALFELHVLLSPLLWLGFQTLWERKALPDDVLERFYAVFSALLAIAAVLWLLWARLRRRPHARVLLRAQQIAAASALLWFQYWVLEVADGGKSLVESVYYGLPLALLACLALLLGALFEGLAAGGPTPAASAAGDAR